MGDALLIAASGFLLGSWLLYTYYPADERARVAHGCSTTDKYKKQDYIKEPNYNGYRSLHLDIRVPVYLSNRTEYVVAEIQLRTIAMDFWASLEHDIRYKVDKTKLPEGINEEMLECSGKIAEIDRKMQDMYRRIKAAEKNTASPALSELKKQDRE